MILQGNCADLLKDIIPFPEKKYNIIYADPPWRYKDNRANYSDWNGQHGRVRMAGTYYDLMSIEQICALPVKDITDKNCALLMWVTNPLLEDGFKVIRAWGFEYKTVAFVWVKRNPASMALKLGLGNYTRPNAEIILLGIKGAMKPVDRSVQQTHSYEVGRHSEKPHGFRNKIVQLFGDLPRIELFARHKINGWDAWGNQVPKTNLLDFITT